MKRTYVFLLVAVLLLAGGLVFLKYQQEAVVLETPQTTPKQSTIKVNNVAVKEEKSLQKLKYTIDLTYPQFAGLKNVTFQKLVNDSLRDWVATATAEFKQDAQKTAVGDTTRNIQYSLMTKGNVIQVNNSVVSVRFEVEDFRGGAHPNKYNKTFNYSGVTGKQLALGDLFKPGSNYLTTLSKIAKADLLNQMKDNPNVGTMVNTGTTPKEENYKNFVLNSKALIVIFDPATVAPNVEGSKEVAVPFKDLQAVLDTQYNLK